MKVNLDIKKARIEILPLIDIVFLLLVFFIYAMLSMAVHRGLTVDLPTSASAKINKKTNVSITIKSDGTIYLDKEKIDINRLTRILSEKFKEDAESEAMLFADSDIEYKRIFSVLDKIRQAGIRCISLQAEAENR
mmetsp:Transcript_28556/g.13221  ORF Transcript_28556/g.13221 Transcript_28556/m.13221 type:complete len:135 (-) Transcript_28556:125-529(-)